MKWIIAIILRMPAKKIAELIIKLFEEIAKRTDNKFDDEAVDVIKGIVEEAFGE